MSGISERAVNLKELGLNEWATQFTRQMVTVQEKGERVYPCGKREVIAREASVPLARVEVLSTHTPLPGAYHIDLHRYTFPDGTVVDEYVQNTVTNCDLHVFLALRRPGGDPLPESLWETWMMGVRSACYCRHTC